MTNRREFLSMSAGLAASSFIGSGGTASAATKSGLDILILGGTGFIGPHQVEYALQQGHRVTTFNRGRRQALFGKKVESLIGNRDPSVDNGLKALEGKRTWDVVIDNSGYIPRHVRASVDLLKKRCDRYIYISSVSVYDFDTGNHFPEDGPLAKAMDTEEMTNDSYGALKAECDRIVQHTLGKTGTIVRPDYIVGPGDHTDRFTYWVNRVYRGGNVLAPSGRTQTVSWVDVRDLCPWLIKLGENNVPGIYNASGPSSRVTREGLMWGLRAITDQPVTFFWPTDDFLEQEKVRFSFCSVYKELSFGNRASMEAGLVYRSLADTAKSTQQWWEAQTAERRSNPRAWLDLEKEASLIAKLKQSSES